MPDRPVIYSRKRFFAADHAATMVNRVELWGGNEPHGHDFVEIALAGQGSGRHLSASGERELGWGDVIVVRPGAWHGFVDCNGLMIHNCCFDSGLLQRELSWLREDPALNFLLWAGPFASNRRGVLVVRLAQDRLAASLASLEALEALQATPHRAETIGRLLIFLDGLAHSIADLENLSQRARQFHPAVWESVRLLESQIAQDWSLGELAARSHLDPSYLVRLFRAEVGLAPIAYLNRCRLERAAGLLLQTPLSIAEVAAQVGWFDQNLFARRFRGAYGMSASEYRKRFGGESEDPLTKRLPGLEGSLSGSS